MKKILLFIVAALCFTTISCNKIEEPTAGNDTIQFNFNILAPGTDTKAAKTGWVNGDKLNIWFDIIGDGQTTPDLVLTYNGSSWDAGVLRSGAQAELKADGKITAVYEGYNDFSAYKSVTYTAKVGNSAAYIEFLPKNDGGWTVMPGNTTRAYSTPLLVFCAQKDYTYSGNTLSATLSGWEFKTRFKVVIKNDNGNMNLDAGQYYLQVKDESDNKARTVGRWCLFFYEVGESVGYGVSSGSDGGNSRGVQEADGIAFYYDSFVTTDKQVTFTLFTPTNTIKTYTTATNKTIAADDKTKCIGVALNYSSFN